MKYEYERLILQHHLVSTLPETNIPPENGSLEYYFPIRNCPFSGPFREGSSKKTSTVVNLGKKQPARSCSSQKFVEKPVMKHHLLVMKPCSSEGEGNVEGVRGTVDPIITGFASSEDQIQ